jgi:hypothetical protein
VEAEEEVLVEEASAEEAEEAEVPGDKDVCKVYK